VPQKSLRAAAATSTLLLGLASVWLVGAFASLETKLADWLVPTSYVSAPASGRAVCGFNPAAWPSGCERSDEAEVYAAVLIQKFGGDEAWRTFVVAPATIDFGAHEYRGPSFDRVDSETLADYRVQNGEPKRFRPLESLPAALVLLDRSEFSKMLRGRRGVDGWSLFYDNFPTSSGFIEFSAVGFDRTRDEAFVYVTRSCGWNCAAGWYVLLGKDADAWRVRKRHLLWQA